MRLVNGIGIMNLASWNLVLLVFLSFFTVSNPTFPEHFHLSLLLTFHSLLYFFCRFSLEGGWTPANVVAP